MAQHSGDPQFESHSGPLKKNSACAVGEGTVSKVVLHKDHLLQLDYELWYVQGYDLRLRVRIHNINEI